MPEVRIGPYLSARDTVPRGSDGRWPHLMTGTDSASGWYISRVRDWLSARLLGYTTPRPLSPSEPTLEAKRQLFI